jgi:protein-tyrosine-phosphatase
MIQTERTVVFVCHHGSAKSVIAAALAESLAAHEGVAVRALARGTDPDDAIPRTLADGLRAAGLGAPLDRPQAPTEAELASAARVVSFGPQLEAENVLHWDEVPAVSEVGYEQTHAAIAERVPALIADLRATQA